MRTIQPGRPQAKLHTVDTAIWEDRLVVVYISGNSLIILQGPNDLLQTITHGEDDSLSAVAVDASTGKIATSNGREVFVYRPGGRDVGALRWTLQGTFTPPNADPAIDTLSWGLPNEVLLGGIHLTLLTTSPDLRSTWHSKPLANPVAHAAFSHDASLIASTARNDRLVKIWRRGFIGGGNERFDPAYLGHPASVTSLRWRGRPRKGKEGEEKHAGPILYTTCVDGKLRVWTANDPHCLQVLQLWAEMDMNEAIPPRIPLEKHMSQKRYAVVIDQWEFASAVESLEGTTGASEREQHTRKYLQDTASRESEVIIVLDDQGNMSAWGLERVGCKARHEQDVVNIAHGERLGLRFPRCFHDGVLENYMILRSIATSITDGRLRFLAQFFDGRLQWLSSRVDRILDPSTTKNLLLVESELSGHTRGSIERLITNDAGDAILSYSTERELITWTQDFRNPDCPLTRGGEGHLQEDMHDVAFFKDYRNDDILFILQKERATIWGLGSDHLSEAEEEEFEEDLSEFKLGHVFSASSNSSDSFIPCMGRSIDGMVINLRVMNNAYISQHGPVSTHGGPKQLTNGTTKCDGGVQDSETSSVLLDVASADRMLTCDNNGSLTLWRARFIFPNDTVYSETHRMVHEKQLQWHFHRALSTMVQHPSLIKLSRSAEHAVVVDQGRNTMQMWNMWTGNLEHTESFASHDTIHSLQWTIMLFSAEDRHPIQHDDRSSMCCRSAPPLSVPLTEQIFFPYSSHKNEYSTPSTTVSAKIANANATVALAVVFAHKVDIWIRAGYDFISNSPAWVCVSQVSVAKLTSNPITAVVWDIHQHLVVAAGNQIFTFPTPCKTPNVSSNILGQEGSTAKDYHISQVALALCASCAVYHPQMLRLLLQCGRSHDVTHILAVLHSKLKYYTEGDDLDSMLGLQSNHITATPSAKGSGSHFIAQVGEDDTNDVVEGEEFNVGMSQDLATKLTAMELPWLRDEERLALVDTVQTVGDAERHTESVDDFGLRYLYALYAHRSSLSGPPSSAAGSSWRQIFWASQSGSQEILTDLTAQQYSGRISWEHGRDTGMFMWMSDIEALRTNFENVARNEYTKTDERNPIDCSLYYLALRKKTVLTGLWRMAHWHREQRATHKMLQNDFSDPRWRTAALKNAYALLGKRRIEYAAAWFLLADDLRSAVAVLMDQLGDGQLAVAVARAYEGDSGPILRELLEGKILPKASQQNNRWMAAWAFWLLGRKTDVLRAFTEPLEELIPNAGSAPIEFRSFRHDDPSLASTYQHVRDAIAADPQNSKHATFVSAVAEKELIMRCCLIYMRAGCGLLALDLVRTFKFTRPSRAILPSTEEPNSAGANDTTDPQQSALAASEETSEPGGQDVGSTASMNGSATTRKKVTEEPSAASILDSFDF